MKVTLFMAMSLNGKIARENGSEDFLRDLDWKTFTQHAKRYGCVIMGRKTYEEVMKWKDYTFDNLKDVQKIIISKKGECKLGKEAYLVSSPQEAIIYATGRGFKQVLLCGGGIVNSEFLKRELVDEVVINIDPIILGKGISLVYEEEFESRMKLRAVRRLGDGIVQVHYIVKK